MMEIYIYIKKNSPKSWVVSVRVATYVFRSFPSFLQLPDLAWKFYARNKNSEETKNAKFCEFKRCMVYGGRLTCAGITDVSLYHAEFENNEASDHDQAHYTSN